MLSSVLACGVIKACQRCEFNSLEFDEVLLSFGSWYKLCSPQVFDHAGVWSLKWSAHCAVSSTGVNFSRNLTSYLQLVPSCAYFEQRSFRYQLYLAHCVAYIVASISGLVTHRPFAIGPSIYFATLRNFQFIPNCIYVRRTRFNHLKSSHLLRVSKGVHVSQKSYQSLATGSRCSYFSKAVIWVLLLLGSLFGLHCAASFSVNVVPIDCFWLIRNLPHLTVDP